MRELREAGLTTWIIVRSGIVVALAALFTVFTLAEGFTRAAVDDHTASTRLLCAVAALTPAIGGYVAYTLVRRRGTSKPVSVTTAAWVALGLANLALVALLVTTGRTG